MIKAIETTYGGYKFRSRLEARWAVYFNECGEIFEYEKEGYELPSGKYLPDFFLPKRNMFVEIKPGPKPPYTTPRIYMAGRMGYSAKNYECDCYRPFKPVIISEYPEDYMKSKISSVQDRYIGKELIHYCGPWQINNGNHSMFHGCADETCSYEEEVFVRSLDGVDKSNIFFAMLDDYKAFGTLVEIGYAKARGKRLLIGYDTDKLPLGEFSCDIKLAVNRENPLWFACATADIVFCGSRENILSKLECWLTENYPFPRELRLARELHIESRSDVVVVYGDPFQVLDDSSYYGYGRSRIAGMFSSNTSRRSAALGARQARFEFADRHVA